MKKIFLLMSLHFIAGLCYGANDVSDILSSFRSDLIRSRSYSHPDSVKLILRDTYCSKLIPFVGLLEAKQKLETTEIELMSEAEPIAGLNLSREMELTMARLKYFKDIRYWEIRQMNITPADRRVQWKNLIDEYNDNILKLIGREKYDQWQELLKPTFERVCRDRLNITAPPVVAKLKQLENSSAVDVYAVNMKALPKQEKQNKIDEIKISLANRVRQFLTQEQFDRWCAYRKINYNP